MKHTYGHPIHKALQLHADFLVLLELFAILLYYQDSRAMTSSKQWLHRMSSTENPKEKRRRLTVDDPSAIQYSGRIVRITYL